MKCRLIRMPARYRRVFPAGSSAVAVFSLLLAGCSFLEPAREPAAPSVFDSGLALMAGGDFAGAELAFRRAASRCESGAEGRRALLFLSFLALDPRNPTAQPDSAALMAARFLNLPGNTPQETLEAEALYITALDYGADPELRVNPENPGFAVRFGDCDQPFPPRDVRPLPTLDNPTSGLLKSLDEERGTLAQENQGLRYTVRQLRRASDSLQAGVDSLEAELARIRQIIRLPDTSVTRRPDTAGARRPDTAVSKRPEIGLTRSPDAMLSRILGTETARPPRSP